MSDPAQPKDEDLHDLSRFLIPDFSLGDHDGSLEVDPQLGVGGTANQEPIVIDSDSDSQEYEVEYADNESESQIKDIESDLDLQDLEDQEIEDQELQFDSQDEEFVSADDDQGDELGSEYQENQQLENVQDINEEPEPENEEENQVQSLQIEYELEQLIHDELVANLNQQKQGQSLEGQTPPQNDDQDSQFNTIIVCQGSKNEVQNDYQEIQEKQNEVQEIQLENQPEDQQIQFQPHTDQPQNPDEEDVQFEAINEQSGRIIACDDDMIDYGGNDFEDVQDEYVPLASQVITQEDTEAQEYGQDFITAAQNTVDTVHYDGTAHTSQDLIPEHTESMIQDANTAYSIVDIVHDVGLSQEGNRDLIRDTSAIQEDNLNLSQSDILEDFEMQDAEEQNNSHVDEEFVEESLIEEYPDKEASTSFPSSSLALNLTDYASTLQASQTLAKDSAENIGHELTFQTVSILPNQSTIYQAKDPVDSQADGTIYTLAAPETISTYILLEPSNVTPLAIDIIPQPEARHEFEMSSFASDKNEKITSLSFPEEDLEIVNQNLLTSPILSQHYSTVKKEISVDQALSPGIDFKITDVIQIEQTKNIMELPFKSALSQQIEQEDIEMELTEFDKISNDRFASALPSIRNEIFATPLNVKPSPVILSNWSEEIPITHATSSPLFNNNFDTPQRQIPISFNGNSNFLNSQNLPSASLRVPQNTPLSITSFRSTPSSRFTIPQSSSSLEATRTPNVSSTHMNRLVAALGNPESKTNIPNAVSLIQKMASILNTKETNKNDVASLRKIIKQLMNEEALDELSGMLFIILEFQCDNELKNALVNAKLHNEKQHTILETQSKQISMLKLELQNTERNDLLNQEKSTFSNATIQTQKEEINALALLVQKKNDEILQISGF